MYLHPTFINMIKRRYSGSHTGNVNQLLEALNKLAMLGELTVVPDYVRNCECIEFCMGDLQYFREPLGRSDDVACMSLCMWAGSVMQALRDGGVQC